METRWWFETPSCPLWRHYNVVSTYYGYWVAVTHNQETDPRWYQAKMRIVINWNKHNIPTLLTETHPILHAQYSRSSLLRDPV